MTERELRDLKLKCMDNYLVMDLPVLGRDGYYLLMNQRRRAMSKEKRQERKQETTQVEQPVQVQADDAQPKRSDAQVGDSEEVTPELKPKLNDAQVAQMAYWLCSAYESASASAQFMQPIADAIKQAAYEVLQLGPRCDLVYFGELVRRLMATIEPTSHRSHHHAATIRGLQEALIILADAGVLP